METGLSIPSKLVSHFVIIKKDIYPKESVINMI